MRTALLALLLTGCASGPNSTGVTGVAGYTPPLAENRARLMIVRSDETLLLPQTARLILNGQLLAELHASSRYTVDVAAGEHVLLVTHRPTGAPTRLNLSMRAGLGYRVRVTLDPQRFPAYDGPARPLQFIKQSLDAPHDDRQPLFRAHLFAAHERVFSRSSARQSEAELDREIEQLPAPPAASAPTTPPVAE